MVSVTRITDIGQLRDLLLGLGFAAAVTAATNAQGHGLTVGLVTVIWATGAALTLRRRAPVVVFGVVTAAAAVYGALAYPGGPFYVGTLLAVYTVATVASRNRSLIMCAASMVVIFGSILVGSGFGGIEAPIHVLFISWAFGAVFMGDATKNRGRYVAGLQERARQAEETRDEEARRRVAEERVRIARDLHDVVAHSLATITVQAAAGSRVFDSDPESSRNALSAIRETSKRALRELGNTLELLRPGDEQPPRRPVPGLANITDLLAGSAAAGIDVKTTVEGDPYAASPAVDVAAYRILQESLTNVIRHAAASEASVILRYAPDFLELEVRDNGAPHIRDSDRRGRGLLGMRERAETLGGSFNAGPLDGGGFRVWARLPAGTPS